MGVPCVAVAVGADSTAMEQMINIVNSSLAFLLPFALIPLVRLTTSSQYMGRFVSGKIEAILIWAATLLCFGINFYTLVAPGGDYFGQYTSMQTVVGVQMNIVQDIVCIFYTVCCVYMAFARVRGSPLPMRDYDEFIANKGVDTEKASNVAGSVLEFLQPQLMKSISRSSQHFFSFF